MTSADDRSVLRPRIVGALGSPDAGLVERLALALGKHGRRVVSTSTAQLLSAMPVLEAGVERVYWNPLAVGGNPSTWTAASQHRLAAGLDTSGEHPLLHSCAWGLQELYFRQVGAALYFCDRIEPLVEIDEAALHIDWEAWASTLTFGGPQGEATPFREIRRVNAASAISIGPEGLRRYSFEPEWLNVELRPDAIDPREIVAQLEALMPVTRSWDAPVDITLSGGWDSRLLAATATRVRGRRKIRSWTTSTDDGIDDDVPLAAPVALAFGLKHRLYEPGPESWLEHRHAAYERLQHQTWMHTWSLPLADRLRGRRGPLLDGLAGDVLFKDTFIDRGVLEAPDHLASLDRLAANLGGRRLTHPGPFAERASEWLLET
ncbi:MAG: asparagine synthase-related protein, partial [Actinomycetota bacterium]|nr:asparagine synthase-related protein [Actinomycetota bacterium]